MPAKKKKYNYDRPAKPVYYDNDEDEEENPFTSYRNHKKTNRNVWIGIVIAIIAFSIFKLPDGTFSGSNEGSVVIGGSNSGSNKYKITGVSKGALHAVNIANGKPESFHDVELVKKALSGKLKKGDIIDAD